MIIAKSRFESGFLLQKTKNRGMFFFIKGT